MVVGSPVDLMTMLVYGRWRVVFPDNNNPDLRVYQRNVWGDSGVKHVYDDNPPKLVVRFADKVAKYLRKHGAVRR